MLGYVLAEYSQASNTVNGKAAAIWRLLGEFAMMKRVARKSHAGIIFSANHCSDLFETTRSQLPYTYYIKKMSDITSYMESSRRKSEYFGIIALKSLAQTFRLFIGRMGHGQ